MFISSNGMPLTDRYSVASWQAGQPGWVYILSTDPSPSGIPMDFTTLRMPAGTGALKAALDLPIQGRCRELDIEQE
jgi:hypothetical protein